LLPRQDHVVLAGRAIRVPHRAGNPGTRRTTTVTCALPLSWPPRALAALTHNWNRPDKDEVPRSSPGRRGPPRKCCLSDQFEAVGQGFHLRREQVPVGIQRDAGGGMAELGPAPP
jgi:hypothetical protein